MRKPILTVIGLALVTTTAGCSQPGTEPSADNAVMMEVAPAIAGGAAAEPTPTTSTPVVQAVEVARIAYVYRYELELPVDQAPALMRRHEQACVSAGPAVCQVIGSESSRHGRDNLSARLELRATPAFLTPFRARLEGDATAAGGRVAMAATDSEDLSRSLSDTEARMRALSTLRDRLQQLLATRTAPLEQLLQTERELARVQGELDATRSALEMMRTRVATSRLTLTYEAAGQLAPDSAFRPVTTALDNALTVFMQTLGVLVIVFAMTLPIALIAVPIVWFVLRRRKAVRLHRAAEPVPPVSDEPD